MQTCVRIISERGIAPSVPMYRLAVGQLQHKGPKTTNSGRSRVCVCEGDICREPASNPGRMFLNPRRQEESNSCCVTE